MGCPRALSSTEPVRAGKCPVTNTTWSKMRSVKKTSNGKNSWSPGEEMEVEPVISIRICPLGQTSSEVNPDAIRQQKEIKGIEIGKEEVKLSLFAEDMIVYSESFIVLPALPLVTMKLPVYVYISTLLVSCFASAVSSDDEITNMADKVLSGPANVGESTGEPKASGEMSADSESDDIFSRAYDTVQKLIGNLVFSI
ncbi:hypothetical protein STEG23_028145 [Scotinomys teguina]